MTDIETGLPALPEGFFWRIRNARELIYMYPGVAHDTQVEKFDDFVVCIMRKGPMLAVPVYRNLWQRLFGAEETELRQQPAKELYSRPVGGVATTESIRDAASVLLNVFNAAKLRERLLGDYPPKKLED